MDLSEFLWLSGEGASALDRWTESVPDDPLAAAVAARAELGRERAALVLEQASLRRRAVRKFGAAASRMLFTRRLLEQASGTEVGAFKAARLSGSGARVAADLCCGAGGDALSMAAAGLRVVLVDRDPLALALSVHNLRAVGLAEPRAVEATLPELPDGFSAEVFHLDPDRRCAGRGDGEERWDNAGLSPGPEGIRALAARFRGGAVKLPTAAPEGFLDLPGETQFLGVRDELREQVLWTGDLGEPGAVSVAEFRDGSWTGFRARLEDARDAFEEDPAEQPGEFVHEPVKALVRSHLFAQLGRSRGLRLLDPSTAWLTGGAEASPLLKSYRVLAHGPLRAGAEKALLSEAGRSCGAVKKRGVAVVPEKALRELRGLPGDPAVLCYLRSRGRKWLVVAEPVGDGN